MDPTQLIKECKSRNEKAFQELIEGHSRLVFSVAFRILNDENEAKDASQETFISVWMNIEKFDESRSFKSWLYKIVTNKCLDTLRRRKKSNLIYQDIDTWQKMAIQSAENPEQKISNREIGTLISGMTEHLSDKQKVVFVLSELQELTHDEIVEITGLTKDSIKSNLNHARRNIGKMLQKHL